MLDLILVLRRCAAFLAVFTLAGGLSAATVRAGDIYTVAGIDVDVTADSAAKARKQALRQAHEKAFAALMGRIVPRAAQARVEGVAYDQITRFVRDFEVANEKTSSVRYLADLTVRFQRQAVRDYLRRNEIPFAETRSKPVTVLALYGAAGDAVLWNDPNPWRAAWSDRGETNGLVPLQMPLGDLADIRRVGVQAALNQRTPALSGLAERYGGEDVLVTQAIEAGNAAQETASAQIISRRVGPDGQFRTWVDNIQQQEGESRAAMYGRAAGRVVREVERAWKLANVVRFESEATMRVQVPLTGLDRWVSVRERLARVPVIGESRLRQLSRQTAEVKLTYYGKRDQLRRALKQVDLRLDKISADRTRTDEEGTLAGSPWVLRPSGVSAPREQDSRERE